jgi:hypothetical protein
MWRKAVNERGEKNLGLKTHQWEKLVAPIRGCKDPNYHTHHSYWSAN